MSDTQVKRSGAADQPADAGLRHGVMTEPELAAQAIANIAPSAVIAFTVAAIYIGAGKGTWLSFALATVVILCVGYCVTVFARRHPSAGSLYTYVGQSLGPFAAYIAGVTLLIGCWGIAAGSLGGAVSYAAAFLTSLGMPVSGTTAYVILTIVLGGFACLFTIWGIRISARVSLVLEMVSITIIMILLVTALLRAGSRAWDPGQFSLSGVSGQGVAAGMVLGILGFVGFSSADALGREAKNPRTAIPRAIMWSASAVGVLYVFAAYTQVALLGDGLSKSANPLQDIADQAQMPGWYTPVLTFGVAASFFAVVVAPLNVVGRIFYVMGKEGVAPASFGRTHERLLTPHRALLIFGPAAVLIDVVLLLRGVDPMEIVVWIDTYATYGYMAAYALVAVACVAYLRRRSENATAATVCATIVVLAMGYVFFANVVPVPAYPLNLLPYLFGASVLIAVGWYLYLKSTRPESITQIGQTENEMMEGVG